jgi:leader peptidase (prepilin peptidase)/N-methyltransferase
VVTLADLPYWFMAGVAISLGLAFGSFSNVVIYRLPRGESVVSPASRCPGCGQPIRGYDNIPLFGWLLLLGKARCCGIRISPRYPLVEALGGLAAWAVFEMRIATLPLDTTWWKALALFALYFALVLGLICAAFIDLEHMILPDEITLGGAVVGILSVPLRGDTTWLGSIGGAAIGFLMIWLPFDVLYRVIRGQPGMGLGDAKLVLLAGAWFGWPAAVFTLLAGAVQGTLAALVVFLAEGRIEEPEAVKREREEIRAAIEAAEGEERRLLEEELAKDPIADEPDEGFGKSRIPFGPFLALAIIEYLLFGRAFVEDYLSFLWLG